MQPVWFACAAYVNNPEINQDIGRLFNTLRHLIRPCDFAAFRVDDSKRKIVSARLEGNLETSRRWIRNDDWRPVNSGQSPAIDLEPADAA